MRGRVRVRVRVKVRARVRARVTVSMVSIVTMVSMVNMVSMVRVRVRVRVTEYDEQVKGAKEGKGSPLTPQPSIPHLPLTSPSSPSPVHLAIHPSHLGSH